LPFFIGESKKKGGIAMETYSAPVNLKGLGIVSVLLGLLGGVFYWWTPLGMVISLAGLMSAFVGLTFVRRKKSSGFGLLIAGLVLCLAALILDCVVAGFGLEVVKFQSLS
jgi:hypothetical protein